MTRIQSASAMQSFTRCRCSAIPRTRIGTRLLDFVHEELARRSIEDLKVAVMVGNTDAERLYERRGLRPAELVMYRFGARTRSH